MKVKIGTDEVILDPKHLEVSETNLNDFLKKFASIFDYYSQKWAKSQYITSLQEDKYDSLFDQKFILYKTGEGCSDKMAEAKSRANEDVIAAKKAWRDSKYITQIMYSYLRSMDKAHEDALNLGYNVRKEMDKIFPQTIKGVSDFDNTDDQVAKLFEDKPEEMMS